MSRRRKSFQAPSGGPQIASPRMIEDAIEATLVFFSVTDTPIHEQDLKDREFSRDPYVIKVKAVVMFFLKTECHMPYTAIGERFDRDHTSVINLVRRVHDFVAQEDLDDIVEYVKDRVVQQAKRRQESLLAGVAG